MVDALAQIAAQRVVPVLRTADAADATATARACIRGGMRVVELTYSTPGVERALGELARTEEGALFGIGTVTEPEQVRSSVASGARFVVTFARQPGVIETALELGTTVICGALTPTEVAECRRAGADAVKLFPVRLVDPGYLGDLRAVLPDVSFVVSGGIGADPESVRPWLDAGAIAVGLGGALGTAAKDGAGEVERRCRDVLGSELAGTG